nr:MBL fold metallo-hydrolase [Deinococcus arboris]
MLHGIIGRVTVVVRPLYANVFLLTTPQGRLLVDSGAAWYAPAFAGLLRAFAPDALLLTHAHVDHAGSAFLAARTGVPVLAHPLEHPGLLGQVHDLPYPARRPELGRVISRLHPKVPAAALRATLPGEDVLGWEVVHLPGHTAGQIGVRRGDTLIAADAVVGAPDGAHLPRAAYNHDHNQALATLKRIAAMDTSVIWPGHGGVLSRAQVAARAVRDDEASGSAAGTEWGGNSRPA